MSTFWTITSAYWEMECVLTVGKEGPQPSEMKGGNDIQVFAANGEYLLTSEDNRVRVR